MIAAPFGSLLDQAVSIQQIVNRAPDWQFYFRMSTSEHLMDFGCSPRRFLVFQFQNRRLNSRRYLTRQPFGSTRKIIESFWPVLFVALFKFVSGLARYPEFAAQIRHLLAGLQA